MNALIVARLAGSDSRGSKRFPAESVFNADVQAYSN
jgi:hypothetical protein